MLAFGLAQQVCKPVVAAVFVAVVKFPEIAPVVRRHSKWAEEGSAKQVVELKERTRAVSFVSVYS